MGLGGVLKIDVVDGGLLFDVIHVAWCMMVCVCVFE